MIKKKDQNCIYQKTPIDSYVRNNDKCKEIRETKSAKYRNYFVVVRTASE